ncbi:hypothetical protein LTR35_001949 [Friedmanniomyces endolithicus]|uniref:Uncharacterized protein n=1 Tax=Friedmanniomyces endolithicus TaxID=329885 RepID=A0AAN6FYJ4_9PEZI|nr:hypothetical protein LTS00_011655 [Friedmanniomyces endolithicus]KAK0291226.1 hypothetical protein LTR35_001949 [Friedmanniomyces endolithicus]KAK0325247.1 hypothetical protein LTR82_003528 [Friedmanniomyces endolithicus]KAK0996892.1 hypothetical protein LTR54_009968 [Friedmanniomyces endolithicus]
MDIHSWLENTADREPPNELELRGFAHLEAEQLGKKHHRKRKRASSDSSLLQSRRHDRAAAVHVAISSDGFRNVGNVFTRHDRQRSEECARSGGDDAPPKTYEKRARHKTKPDRYEPKAKKHFIERGSREDKKAEVKPRKSRRSGDGGQTVGLVQGFQLKNGPQKSRLTLKPETNAGLFNHGRASAQVAGRGAGLPDLVFNELRFLRKPEDHQDEAQTEITRANGKKDTQRQREEEISAYFTRDRDVLVDHAETGHEPEAPPGVQQQRSRTAQIKTVIKLPEKPFLGFGSKGQHANSRRTGPTSCYTWSESVVPEPRASRSKRPRAGDIGNGRLMQVPRDASSADGSDKVIGDFRQAAALKQHTESITPPKRGKWVRSQRSPGPGVEVLRPPDKHSHKSERRTATRATLRSLPHSEPSEFPPPAVRTQRTRHSPRNPEFHTPDILLVRQEVDPAAAVDNGHSHDTLDTVDQIRLGEKENRDPETSTPTSGLLRQAQQAVSMHKSDYHAGPRVMRQRHEVRTGVRHIPYPRGADSGHCQQQSTSPESHYRLPDRRLWSASSLPQLNALPAVRHGVDSPSRSLLAVPLVHPRHTAHAVLAEEDDMLDQDQNVPYERHCVYAQPQQAEALATNLSINQRPGLYEAQDHEEDVLYDEIPSRASSGLLAARTSSSHDVSIGHDFRSDRSTGLEGGGGCDLAADGEFAGFWKPNRLY